MTTKEPTNGAVQTRYMAYLNRTETAREWLLADIYNWRNKFLPESVTNHHLNQFFIFCDRILKQLDSELGRSEEDITFKSQVIGSLTTQWLMARDVASLRLNGSPYQEEIDLFDRLAARYYRVVVNALPDGMYGFIPTSTPLVFLDRTAEVTLFNYQNQMPPAIISIPFGAVYDPPPSRSRLAIAHEVGHIVLNRVQRFQPQLCTTLRAAVLYPKETRLTRQQRLVRQVILRWANEMVADLVGMALAGPAFAQSAFTVIAGPESHLGITDETHPVPVIRPYLYLEFLDYLAGVEDKSKAAALRTYVENIDDLKKRISTFVSEQHLKRRFESMPALTKVTLEDVRNEMQAVTRIILTHDFGLQKGKKKVTFGEILIDCAINIQAAAKEPLASEQPGVDEWGQNLELDDPFVLNLSNLPRPTFATPVTLGDFYCDFFGICEAESSGNNK